MDHVLIPHPADYPRECPQPVGDCLHTATAPKKLEDLKSQPLARGHLPALQRFQLLLVSRSKRENDLGMSHPDLRSNPLPLCKAFQIENAPPQD
jgi:hypothetical protein